MGGNNLSLCRSTVLDSWNELQLRAMKLSGNAAVAAGLGVQVGGSAASPGKYSSRQAIEYKNDLLRRAKLDQKR